MKPDLLDQSFLRRLERAVRPPDSPATLPPAGTVAGEASPVVPPALAPAPSPGPTPSPRPCSLLDRLLAEAHGEWLRMAECIEDAAARGRRTVAVAGGRRGEGRTTLVRGLARLLGDRGRKVICIDGGPRLVVPVNDADEAITLVDAGVWFPPGPLRRSIVERASLGCDAVITVRRADQAACAARASVVEAVGLEFLGEVVTFSPVAA
ncbi:MAG: hypothetical protein EBZ59_05965 [Planctomycetia bacterium]|nr:hypothetical protein [Planctomycetia bacterium]